MPTLLFGENDMFWTHIPVPGSFSAWMQRAVQTWFGFTMPKFWGEPLLWGESAMQRWCHTRSRCVQFACAAASDMLKTSSMCSHALPVQCCVHSH